MWLLAAVLRDQGMAVDGKVTHRFYDDVREVPPLHRALIIAFREAESRVLSGHTAYRMSILQCPGSGLFRRETSAKRASWRSASRPAGARHTCSGSCQTGTRSICWSWRSDTLTQLVTGIIGLQWSRGLLTMEIGMGLARLCTT